MDKILKSIGKSVEDKRLFNPKNRDPETMFHRKMRLAALLHDIGTFPFSHSVEHGYISHFKKQIAQGKNNQAANHEELGSFIINHTNFEGGITEILKTDGFDPKEISLIIRGQSNHWLANQLLHSDIDADRIDYLMRDSHYTGVKYGVFDMDYLISNMRAVKQDKNEVLAINEGAMTVVEYFLISRYSWYTQIINEGTGYKFDMLAAKVAEFFIESGAVYSFEELKILVKTNPRAFFGFNDSYFTSKLQASLENNSSENKRNSDKLSNQIVEMIEMLMFRIPLHQIKVEPFESSLIKTTNERVMAIENIHKAAQWLRSRLEIIPNGWIIEDIPTRDVIFTKSDEALKKLLKGRMSAQESVRIIGRDNKLRLLVDVPNSLISILANYQNFIPRVYVSSATHRYLQSKNILKELSEKFSKMQSPLKKSA